MEKEIIINHWYIGKNNGSTSITFISHGEIPPGEEIYLMGEYESLVALLPSIEENLN